MLPRWVSIQCLFFLWPRVVGLFQNSTTWTGASSVTLFCPPGLFIVAAFSYSYNPLQETDCSGQARGCCVPGASNCTVNGCSGEFASIWIACDVDAFANGRTYISASGTDLATTITCTSGKTIAFGARLHYTAYSGTTCLQDNNQPCTVGGTQCGSQDCNTAWPDNYQYVWAMCQPTSPYKIASNVTYDPIGAVTATCPMGYQIAFGYRYKYGSWAGGAFTANKSSCISASHGSCTAGYMNCTNPSCVLSTFSSDHDVSAVILACEPAPTPGPTLSPTFSPTSAPSSPTLSPTLLPTHSPTPSPNSSLNSTVIGKPPTSFGAGGIAAVVIIPLLALGMFICCYRKAKFNKMKTMVPKGIREIHGPNNVKDPPQVALNGTIELCKQCMGRASKGNKLILQSVIVGAEEAKREFPKLQSHGSEMRSLVTPSDGISPTTFMMEDFEHVRFLAEGQGGTINLYREKTTKHEFVLKVPHRDRDRDNSEEVITEATVWSSLGLHPNVAQIIGIGYLGGHLLGIMMKYYANGSLGNYARGFSSQALVKIAIGLSRGLQYLHDHKIIHRDLAARNVLVAQDGSVVITDFGLSRKLNENHEYKQLTSNIKLPWRLLAPELLMNGTPIFTEKTDIWALGVTLWELATQKTAFGGCSLEQLKEKIGSGELTLDMEFVIMAHPNLVPALVGCLNRDPALRPTAEQLRWLLKDDPDSARNDHDSYIATVQGHEYAIFRPSVIAH